MMRFEVNNKVINIYNEDIIRNKKVPIIIHNSFDSDGKELWEECQKIKCSNFILVNISNINWNDLMTPWKCCDLLKKGDTFNGDADNYILELTRYIIPEIENKLEYSPLYYGISGYSLAGLFSLYAVYKTNVFQRVISCSGSFWYPKFVEFIKKNEFLITPLKIYLSLGDKEKNSKNEFLRDVQKNTEDIYQFYISKGINIKYELNFGGHFKDCDLRLAKGIKDIIG